MDSVRELTIAKILHPEYLESGAYLRVDHPGLNALTEYDARCVIYVNLLTDNFVLFRLEHDNVYRPTAKLPSGRCLNEATINQLIARLTAIDTRQGFNPLTDILAAGDRQKRHQASERRAWLSDYADKLHWGLAHSHLPGVDITRPRQVMPKGR